MFEDFADSSTQEGRGRRGVSVLLSLGIFGALALVVGGAITAHQVRRHRALREQQVEFASLPQVRAPKPKVQVLAASKKPAKPKRQKVVDLKAIPTVRPEEAEGDLVVAEDTGAEDGILEAKPASPTGTMAAAPPLPKPEPVPIPTGQERESIEAPRFISGCRAPEVPNGLLSKAATIRIEVEMLIDNDGKVTSAKVLSSHALVPDELVLSCARAQVFDPARLPDGTKVPYPLRRRFVFKPAQV